MEGRCDEWEACGKFDTIVWACIKLSNGEKKKASTTVGSMEGICKRQEVCGNCDIIIWGIELSNQK